MYYDVKRSTLPFGLQSIICSLGAQICTLRITAIQNILGLDIPFNERMARGDPFGGISHRQCASSFWTRNDLLVVGKPDMISCW